MNVNVSTVFTRKLLVARGVVKWDIDLTIAEFQSQFLLAHKDLFVSYRSVCAAALVLVVQGRVINLIPFDLTKYLDLPSKAYKLATHEYA